MKTTNLFTAKNGREQAHMITVAGKLSDLFLFLLLPSVCSLPFFFECYQLSSKIIFEKLLFKELCHMMGVYQFGVHLNFIFFKETMRKKHGI